MIHKKTFVIMMLLNFFLFIAVLLIIYNKGGIAWVEYQIVSIIDGDQKHEITYEMIRKDVFRQLQIGKKDIVLLGDSIIDFGEWHELFSDVHVKNRAIAGNTAKKLYEQLELLVSSNPAYWVLQIGINDLQNGRSIVQTQYWYNKIVQKLLRTTNSQIILLPIFPVNQVMYSKWYLPNHIGFNMPYKEDILTINGFIRQLAKDNGNRIRYISVLEITNQVGELRENFTLDGIHLNGRALAKVAHNIKQSIDGNTLINITGSNRDLLQNQQSSCNAASCGRFDSKTLNVRYKTDPR